MNEGTALRKMRQIQLYSSTTRKASIPDRIPEIISDTFQITDPFWFLEIHDAVCGSRYYRKVRVIDK